MIDRARSFVAVFGPRPHVEIVGKTSTMRVTKRDLYRLIMVCLAIDKRWEMLPADWRNYFTSKK